VTIREQQPGGLRAGRFRPRRGLRPYDAASGPRGMWRAARSGDRRLRVRQRHHGNARRARGRFALAEAISPARLRQNGPDGLYAVSSKCRITAWQRRQLNFRFSPTAVRGADGRKSFRTSSRYFDEGGMQVQFIVVGTDTLYVAAEKPRQIRQPIVARGLTVYSWRCRSPAGSILLRHRAPC
jgi:hypothetical protein